MPAVKPVSDLQRNLGAVSAECHASGQPVYLTKNGVASLVIMDAEAFDKKFAVAEELLRREERVARALNRGYDDLVNGRVRSWELAKADAGRIREARNAD